MPNFVTRSMMSLTVGFLIVTNAEASIEWRQDVVSSVPGTITNDLYVTARGDISVVEMLLSAPGGIYRDRVGGITPPNTAFFPLPTATYLFDTYVALGTIHDSGPAGWPQIAGGAVDIGGAPGVTFDESLLDVSWFVAPGRILPGDVPQFVARVTLLDTANSEDVTVFVQSSYDRIDVICGSGRRRRCSGAFSLSAFLSRPADVGPLPAKIHDDLKFPSCLIL